MFKQKNKQFIFMIYLIIFFILLNSGFLIFTHFQQVPSRQTSNEQTPEKQISIQKSQSGVAITFDDTYVDEWFEIRDLLKKYNANVTFFVSRFQELNESQVNKLKILQEDGNEIAFHGYLHRDQEEYMKDHSTDDYLNNEIINGVTLMKKAGFEPLDFSYPFGSVNKTLAEELKKEFLHTRAIAPLKNDLIYYQYGSNETQIYGFEIDEIKNYSLNDIYHAILRGKEKNNILILYAHKPVKTNPGDYDVSFDRLEKILIMVSENKMKFYKINLIIFVE